MGKCILAKIIADFNFNQSSHALNNFLEDIQSWINWQWLEIYKPVEQHIFKYLDINLSPVLDLKAPNALSRF